MRPLHLSVAVAGLLGLSAFAWWWQQRAPGTARAEAAVPGTTASAAAPAGPVPVEVARAEVQAVSDDVSAVGSLRSSQAVVIRPEISGRVVKLGFADGQAVKQGQLLVQLDDALPQAQLRQARAQLDIAVTTLRRNQELVAQAFVTQSVVDQAQANVNVAEAQVALARAQVERLRIVAPFDGQAGIRLVDVGEYLKDGAAIVALEDLSSLYVDFSLPERFAAQLRRGQSVAVQLDALPGQTHSAQIEAIEPQISADGRAIAARGRIARPGPTLRPGMFARVKVVLAQRADAVMVPEEALLPQAGRDYLVKVVDGPAGPRPERIEVRTGVRRDGKVEILRGVAVGERVVTAGHGRLQRGDALPLQLLELQRTPPSGAPRIAGTASDSPPTPPAHATR